MKGVPIYYVQLSLHCTATPYRPPILLLQFPLCFSAINYIALGLTAFRLKCLQNQFLNALPVNPFTKQTPTTVRDTPIELTGSTFHHLLPPALILRIQQRRMTVHPSSLLQTTVRFRNAEDAPIPSMSRNPVVALPLPATSTQGH